MFTLKDFLLEEVKPALGCTEPGAVALCVARACEELKDRLIESIEVTTSASIYKNGMYVGIPGTNGLKGNYVAAALGAVCGKSALGLEVLKPCSSEAVKDALKMLDEGRIRIIPEMERSGVFVKAVVVSTSGEQAVCIIEGSHTNITRIEKDGKIIEMVKTDNAIERLKTGQLSVSEQIAGMSYREVLKVLDNMNAGDVEYIIDGVEMNMNIAEYGFANNTGLEYGSLIRDLAKSSWDEEAGLPTKIKAWCAAAADARMGGASLPVMSSAGSGNHGITAILPVFIVGKHDGKSREEIAKAIALSHLTTSFIKSRMGRLSPVCGCSVAAGAGAAAGIAFLRSGSLDAAERAVVVMIANLVGMICDGAKETCALKVGTGAIEAYYAAMLALQGGLASPQGIVEETIEKTVENAAQLNTEGMKDIDVILIHQIQRR
ncbi:MAG TPA: L-serine ammonia-lyase, iron-sulfur-dependent, subunit alpha [Thermosynergistes sp.]|nr:L-serine ammonia-lyase, iron-sulfur-dependent, subunit alpha [Thermosynergistes sp.]HPZ76398.1 L-serine ammonia-lyase, iron-sulfur-dependent, subunit alpha [Thermosynergistes sp.]